MAAQQEVNNQGRQADCNLKEFCGKNLRCQYFVSIFKAMRGLESGESDFLNAVPEIRKVIETASEIEGWRVPIYITPNAFGICLNRGVLSRRDEVEIRVTTVKEGTADDLRKVLGSAADQVGRGEVKVLQELDDQGRPLRRIVVTPGDEVTVLEKKSLLRLLDIGCYDSTQKSYDQIEY